MSKLDVSIQGVRGGDFKKSSSGSVRVTAIDEGIKDRDLHEIKDNAIDIYVDVFQGAGSDYQRRDKTLINIRCNDQDYIFTGTIDELIERLKSN